MWKLITGICRKPGMSAEAFRDYYERQHAVIAAAVLEGYAVKYRRNYVVDRRYEHPGRTERPAGAAPDFDCFAEVWFPSREALDALLAHMQSAAVGDSLTDDRAHFVDPALVQYMICEEVGGD